MNKPVSKLLEQKNEGVEAVSPQTAIGEAVERMNQRQIGSLLVMDGDRLVGIFTERDVLTRVVPQQLDPKRTPVGEVMTRNPISIAPTRTVQDAMMVMTDTRHRHLPVVQ